MQDIPPEGRRAISTVANIIQSLALHNIPLSDTLISSAYEWLLSQTDEEQGMVSADTGRRMVEEVTGVQISARA